jgi:hypothetical protein
MIDLDILLVLDRSGSMQSRKADHEGGVRAFVEDQRTLAGDVRFTLVQFDSTDPCEIVYDRVPLDAVDAITLIPRGATPLLDAVGRAVAHLRARQGTEPSQSTLIMVVTDGEENASTEWTKDRVKALLGEIAAAGGTTLFLGADIDAFHEAGSLGVSMAHALNIPNQAANLVAAYAVTSHKVKTARALLRGGASAQAVSASLDYLVAERHAVLDATEEP